jgi:putative NIF3 family GTP cyclohydrolase 1 type 2
LVTPSVSPIKVAGDLDAPVRRIAVLPGSGDGFFDQVRAAQADVYVTSDLRHHPALDLRQQAGFERSFYGREIARPFLIDVPHSSAEAVFLPELAKKLTEIFPQLQTQVSLTSSDPWDFAT